MHFVSHVVSLQAFNTEATSWFALDQNYYDKRSDFSLFARRVGLVVKSWPMSVSGVRWLFDGIFLITSLLNKCIGRQTEGKKRTMAAYRLSCTVRGVWTGRADDTRRQCYDSHNGLIGFFTIVTQSLALSHSLCDMQNYMTHCMAQV